MATFFIFVGEDLTLAAILTLSASNDVDSQKMRLLTAPKTNDYVLTPSHQKTSIWGALFLRDLENFPLKKGLNIVGSARERPLVVKLRL